MQTFRMAMVIVSVVAGSVYADGPADWDRSCAQPDTDGLCVRSVQRTAGCRASSDIEAVPRTAAAARALAAFRNAKGDWSAQRRVADADLEAFFAVPVPSLDKTKNDADFGKRLMAFTHDKGTRAQPIREEYLAIVEAKDAPPAERVIALERLGRLYTQFATNEQSMPIPTALVGADTKDAYCQELDQSVAPLLDEAKQAFTKCAKTAADLKLAAPPLCVAH